VVGIFHEKPTAIIINIVDGFRIIRVFIRPFSDIAFNHVIENLENVSENVFRDLCCEFYKLIKGDGRSIIPLTNFLAYVG
jgi:hypothetical protein